MPPPVARVKQRTPCGGCEGVKRGVTLTPPSPGPPAKKSPKRSARPTSSSRGGRKVDSWRRNAPRTICSTSHTSGHLISPLHPVSQFCLKRTGVRQGLSSPKCGLSPSFSTLFVLLRSIRRPPQVYPSSPRLFRHPRAGGDPAERRIGVRTCSIHPECPALQELLLKCPKNWIPACAGMTNKGGDDDQRRRGRTKTGMTRPEAGRTNKGGEDDQLRGRSCRGTPGRMRGDRGEGILKLSPASLPLCKPRHTPPASAERARGLSRDAAGGAGQSWCGRTCSTGEITDASCAGKISGRGTERQFRAFCQRHRFSR